MLALTLLSGALPVAAYAAEYTDSDFSEPQVYGDFHEELYEVTDENELNALDGGGWFLRDDGTLIVGGENWHTNWLSSKGEVPQGSKPVEEGGKTNAELVTKVILGFRVKRESYDSYYMDARRAEYIFDEAFKDCVNLKTVEGLEAVNYPEGCEIGERAFFNCSRLPCPGASVVSGSGAYAFCGTFGYDIGGLYWSTEDTWRENDCTMIGTRLINCTCNDRVIRIPDGVERIDFKFYDAYKSSRPGKYIQELILPESIKSVTGFDGCSDLVKVTFLGVPETIESFNNCPKLSEITIPDGTRKVSGFSGCPSLTSVDIPASVEELGGFEEYANLEAVSFHDGKLKTIAENSFRSCGKLDNVSLPSPLEEIGEGVFSDCAVLKDITFPDTVCRVFADLENIPWYYEQPLGEPLYIGSCYMGFPYDYYGEYPESVTLRDGTPGISAKYGPAKFNIPSSVSFIGDLFGRRF